MDSKRLPDVALIRRAHDYFLDTGKVSGSVVPGVIERSWLRCAQQGVRADRIREPGRLDQGDLRSAWEKQADLIEAAEPVMDVLHQQLQDTGSIILLCGADGLILRSMGDPEFVSRAERVALKPGVSWAEEQKGTNAIGTAIIERAPVVVYAAQHYIERNHFLTCSATPVFDASGELAAILDITGDYRAHQPHTLALVRVAGRNIERQLFLRRFQRDLVLQLHARSNYLGSLFDGRAAFSEAGQLLAADHTGCDTMGIGGERLRTTFDELFESTFGQALVELRRDQPVIQLRLRRGGQVIYAQLARGLPSLEERPYTFVRGQPAAAPRYDTRELDMLHAGDARMSALLARIKRTLGRDIPVLIEGETGTGKELLAKALHASGPRAGQPFVAVNCAAIPEGLIESELFGYEEGAFTGARRRGQPGRIVQADGGTLFLDEIGDMPMTLQARLLRVLQEREVLPLGGREPRRIDVAIVCATHRELSELVAQRTFREDLYYRLNGLVVRLPPLRDRSDIALLVERILASEVQCSPSPRISAEVMQLLVNHPWPGNLRQLRSVLRSALALMDDSGVIQAADLPDDFVAQAAKRVAASRMQEPGPERLEQIEAQAIRTVVAANSGNLSAAAKKLGISRATLYRKLKTLSAQV